MCQRSCKCAFEHDGSKSWAQMLNFYGEDRIDGGMCTRCRIKRQQSRGCRTHFLCVWFQALNVATKLCHLQIGLTKSIQI